MQVKFKNYTKDEVKKLLFRFKSQILKDCFVVQKTAKNEATKRTFKLNKTKIKELLLSLSEEDFKYKIPDNNYDIYGPELLDVYKKQVTLINFYGEEEVINLYIKIKETEKGILPIISFHEDDKEEEERE